MSVNEENDSVVSEEAGASSVESSREEIATIPDSSELWYVEEVGAKCTMTDSPTPTVSAIRMTSDYTALHIPHKSYTVYFKLKVLDWYYANGENKKQTADHFGIDRKRVRDWLKLEQQLRAAPEFAMQRIRSTPGCPPMYEELDKTVLEWYKSQAEQGVRISDRVLRTKALELAPELGLKDVFKGSPNWAASWRRRNRPTIMQYLSPEERAKQTTAKFEQDLQRYGLNSESDFATVAEAISGVRLLISLEMREYFNLVTHSYTVDD